MALSPPDRARLVNILELGSRTTFAGERSAAAEAAYRLLAARGLNWADVIAEPEAARCRDDAPATWRADIDLVQRHPQFCTEWERGFANSIAHRPRISPKQLAILTRIATGIRAGGKS